MPGWPGLGQGTSGWSSTASRGVLQKGSNHLAGLEFDIPDLECALIFHLIILRFMTVLEINIILIWDIVLFIK